MVQKPKMTIHAAVEQFRSKANGQVVLVLQGGGALGAYQVGVYHALHEAGVEPDWIIGTSIGAINASIIAGNQPSKRGEKLQQFWHAITHDIWPINNKNNDINRRAFNYFSADRSLLLGIP